MVATANDMLLELLCSILSPAQELNQPYHLRRSRLPRVLIIVLWSANEMLVESSAWLMFTRPA